MKPGMDDKELLRQIAQLPREISPANDAWDAVAVRIGEQPADANHTAVGKRWMLRAVAAVVVTAVATGLIMNNAWQRPTAPAPQLAQAATETVPAAPYKGLMAGSEAEYQAAFREYISIGNAREQLPRLAVEKIESGWADLVKTEIALTGALAQNPNDPFLNNRLLELRSRQLGFLKQLAALDRNNRRLTI